MPQFMIDLSTKHIASVLKHDEENGLPFENALLDILESHADQQKEQQALRLTEAVEEPEHYKVVPQIGIRQVYGHAETMELGEEFTMFDVIKTMDPEDAEQITEDQMRGWGTPFANWISAQENFMVAPGNASPRRYIRTN